MNNPLLDLKRRSMSLGLCGAYKAQWDKAKDKQALFDTATDINGMLYLADVCTFKWSEGFNTDYIYESFSEYINGKYMRDKDGYTSRLYCNHVGSITADSTVLCLLHCNSVVYLPHDSVTTRILGDNTKVSLVGMGKVNEVYIYGSSDVTNKHFDANIINKSEWAK